MSGDQHRESKVCTPSDNPFKPISFADRLSTQPKRGEHTHTTSFQPLRPGQMYSYVAPDTEPWLSPANALPPMGKPAQPVRPRDPPRMQVDFAKLLRTEGFTEPVHAPEDDTQTFTPARAQKTAAKPFAPSSAPDPAPPSAAGAGLPPYLKKSSHMQAHSMPMQAEKPAPAAEENDTEASLFTSFSSYQSVLAAQEYPLAAQPPTSSSNAGIIPDVHPNFLAPPALAKPAPFSHSPSIATSAGVAPATDLTAYATASTRRRRTERHAIGEGPFVAPNAKLTPLSSMDTDIPNPSSAAQQVPANPADADPLSQLDLPISPEWPQRTSPPFFQPAGVLYNNEPWKQVEPQTSARTPDMLPYAHANNDGEPPFVVDEIEAFFRSDFIDAREPSYSNQSAPAPYSEQLYGATAPMPTSNALQSRKSASPSRPKLQQPKPQQAVFKQFKPQPPKPKTPVRPPLRPWRVISLFAAAIMLVFCAIVGGRMIVSLVRNEWEMKGIRASEADGTGNSLDRYASRVELLAHGQTYTPTDSPVAIQTPTPTPIIAFNGNAGPDSRDNSAVQEIPKATPTPKPRTRLTSYPDNPLRNIIPSIAELNKQYSEAVGQVTIKGVLNEIIVQRNNTFYLNHNYRGSASETGAVFVDESCTLKNPPENLLLRGQASVAGKLFAPLWQFETGGQGFVAKTTALTLTTLYEESRFVLFAVIVADSDPQSRAYFNFASQPTFASDDQFMRYVQSAQEHSLYRFNVDVTPSDRLLTLSTLGNGTDNRCLVLIYRMLRPGE